MTTEATKASGPARSSGAAVVRERMAVYLQQSDDLADAVVADFSRMRPGEGSALLNRALATGIESCSNAPATLRAFFADLEDEPLWLDREEIDHGANAVLRTGALGAAALLCHSLPTGYLDPISSMPLVFSGRLVNRAPRRLMETARFVYECCKPGGLERDGAGYHISVRVRLMHAQVRRLLLQSGRWQSDVWGHPISQYHLLGTNALFSLAVVEALQRWGVYISRSEERAIYALWRYNGFLMGVRREILPAGPSECKRILDAQELGRPPADDNSRILTAALIEAGADMSTDILGFDMRGLVRAALQGMTRNLLGNSRADELGLAKNGFRFVPYLLWPAVRSAETLRLILPGTSRLAVAIGRRLWERSLKIGLHGREAEFAMPEKLKAQGKPNA